MDKIRVLVVNKHPELRQWICDYLNETEDIEAVAATADGEEAVRLVDRLHPDVVVTGLVLGNSDPIQVTRRILKAQPETRVLLYTFLAPGTETQAAAALEAGAVGYVLKTDPPEVLCRAIRRACRGTLDVRGHQRKPSEPSVESSSERGGLSTFVSLSSPGWQSRRAVAARTSMILFQSHRVLLRSDSGQEVQRIRLRP